VWYLEDLLGALSELINLTLNTHFLNWVLDLFDVYHALVGKRVEKIEGLYRFLPSLLVPENQVNPLVQVLGNVLRLKGFSIHF
jgi:hypothetical protein